MKSLETEYGVILQDRRGTVVFDPSTLKVYRLELPADASIDQARQWIETNKPGSLSTPYDEPENDPLSLCLRPAFLPLLIGDKELEKAGGRAELGRLTLNVSNLCNLRCEYCYADHGAYQTTESFMPAGRAASIIAKVLEYWSPVGTVQFFGGEPLLNLKAVNETGRAFEAALEADIIQSLPGFTVTTNGTLSNTSVLNTLKRWDIEATVSWDGPPEVQDVSRPLAHQDITSSELIETTIDRFLSHRIRFGIECTYNHRHSDSGISVVELMDFIHHATGLRVVHISPASLPADERNCGAGQKTLRKEITSKQPLGAPFDCESLVPVFREAANYSLKNLFRGEGPTLSLVNSIVSKLAAGERSKYYCGAFHNQLSIDVDGFIFPCFMFAGDPAFRLGNILNDSLPSEMCASVFRRYFNEFGLIPAGTSDWYGPLFSGCIAGDYIMTNTLSERSWSLVYKAMIEECIIEISSHQYIWDDSEDRAPGQKYYDYHSNRRIKT